MSDLKQSFDTDGTAAIPQAVPTPLLDELRAVDATPGGSRRRGGMRNVLDLSIIQAAVNALRPLARELAGSPSISCGRGILFDKTPESNWAVAWHQDRSIAVDEQCDVAGYGPWSMKHGVTHVQPPVGVLERIVTLRLHMDDCPPENGPLRTLPGGHTRGILSDEQLAALRESTPEREHAATAGEVLAMRPLVPHASSPAARPGRRRVLHLEFSPDDLPRPLQWRWAC